MQCMRVVARKKHVLIKNTNTKETQSLCLTKIPNTNYIHGTYQHRNNHKQKLELLQFMRVSASITPLLDSTYSHNYIGKQ